jgi:hypothetical protein
MPNPKQMEKLAREVRRQKAIAPDQVPNDTLPTELWDGLLANPRATGKPPLPIQQHRLSEIPRHLLRVECMHRFRIIEIQKSDAIKYHGPHAVWKDVGQRLLDQTCSNSKGRHEEDGCWPNWG